MTMSTLEFQPEAERYYAQGYWQDGDLWSDFDARSRAIGKLTQSRQALFHLLTRPVCHGLLCHLLLL